MPALAATLQQQRQARVNAGLEVFEFNYNGVTFGGGRSDYALDTFTGLGMPPVRKSSTPKLSDHGSLLAAQFLDERVMVAAGMVTGSSRAALEARKIALGAACIPRRLGDALPLTMLLGDGISRQVFVVPTRGPTWDMDAVAAKIRVLWAVEFTAADPRIYAAVPTVTTVLPQTPSVGFAFDFGFDFDFGGGNPGYATLRNHGNLDTPPFVRIVGPATDPRLIKKATGEELSLTITLGREDHLDIDFASRTITLNGSASRYGDLDIGSIWFTVDPGDNLVQFLASNTDTPTQAQFTYRDAWGAV